MKKKQEANKKGMILAIVFALIAVIGVTYALFQYQKLGTKRNTITTGTLILTLDESKGNAITVSNAVPMSDLQGEEEDSYHFELENTGTLPAKYRIRLEEDQEAITADACGTKKMTDTQLKVSLEKDGVKNTPTLLSGFTQHIIDTGTLEPGGKIIYDLRLWIDSGVGIEANGKHFHGKIYIDGIVDGHTDWTTGK